MSNDGEWVPFRPGDTRYFLMPSRRGPIVDADDIALARRFLDLPDEDFTFIDPEEIKRLARAVLAKVD